MALGRGRTEHAGARDMTRKHGHWGFTEEAKEWASRARRRDDDDHVAAELTELREKLADAERADDSPEPPDHV